MATLMAVAVAAAVTVAVAAAALISLVRRHYIGTNALLLIRQRQNKMRCWIQQLTWITQVVGSNKSLHQLW